MDAQLPMPAQETDRRLLRLRASVQNYDWGLKGKHSQVARLCALNSGSAVEPEKPYAELWMGTHESGSSFVIPGGGRNGFAADSESVTLKDWISKNSSVLGDKVLDRWGCDLPFLFKVLSVAKALSIQAHPDKESARTLHKSLPKLYKDANHKPEMALAITQFEALCSFISLEELKGVLRNVPEIIELVGKSNVSQILCVNGHNEKEPVKSALKSLFTQLMSADKELIAETISKLITRLHKECKIRQLTDKEQLVLRLEEQYPADVGVISAFFFNYVKLKPGEALYLGANEPHAYLSGECVECMATSDNVVRAGLTPKHRDVQTLCSMLTYKQGFPEILPGVNISPYITRYLPPFDEFEVDHCLLPKGKEAVFPTVPGPSIFLVTSGEGAAHTKASKDIVREGDVVFAPANTAIRMISASGLQVYRAGVNSRFLGDLEV